MALPVVVHNFFDFKIVVKNVCKNSCTISIKLDNNYQQNNYTDGYIWTNFDLEDVRALHCQYFSNEKPLAPGSRVRSVGLNFGNNIFMKKYL